MCIRKVNYIIKILNDIEKAFEVMDKDLLYTGNNFCSKSLKNKQESHILYKQLWLKNPEIRWSNNKQNVVLATIEALSQLKTPEEVARLRGKSVEEVVG